MENKEIEKKAKNIRNKILDMVYKASSGHIGGSFSAVEILSVVYFNELNIDNFKKDMCNPKKDIFILSKGHSSPAIYSVLAEKGFINERELDTFRDINGTLEGHPKKNINKGIEYSAGSLGQGLSYAIGIAIARKYEEKIKKEKFGKIYVLVGDGELDEGQNYEALMTAAKYNLDNLIILVDSNKIQLDGRTDEIMPHLNLSQKIASFGIITKEVDGHDISQIKEAFQKIKNSKEKKVHAIVFNTIKGKGVSFMENTSTWHGKAPNEEEYLKAKAELGGKNE